MALTAKEDCARLDPVTAWEVLVGDCSANIEGLHRAAEDLII